jgi:hypothetical protein
MDNAVGQSGMPKQLEISQAPAGLLVENKFGNNIKKMTKVHRNSKKWQDQAH